MLQPCASLRMKCQTSSHTCQLHYHYEWIAIFAYFAGDSTLQTTVHTWIAQQSLSVHNNCRGSCLAFWYLSKKWNVNLTANFSGNPQNDSCGHWAKALQPFWLCEYRVKHFTSLVAYISTLGGTPSSNSLQPPAHLLCWIYLQYTTKDGSAGGKKLR